MAFGGVLTKDAFRGKVLGIELGDLLPTPELHPLVGPQHLPIWPHNPTYNSSYSIEETEKENGAWSLGRATPSCGGQMLHPAVARVACRLRTSNNFRL